MVIIIGKTCSGKTQLVNQMVQNGFKKIITHTTRPIRVGEQQDIDYHFLQKNEFISKLDNGDFAEYKKYDTVNGVWYYGTSLDDLNSTTNMSVMIITPDGFKDIRNKFFKKPLVIYVYSNNATIHKRLLNRGDSKEEAARRMKHDNLDFKGAELLADRIFYNNDGKDLSELTAEIIKYIKQKEN